MPIFWISAVFRARTIAKYFAPFNIAKVIKVLVHNVFMEKGGSTPFFCKKFVTG